MTKDAGGAGPCADSYCLRLAQILQDKELYSCFLGGLTPKEQKEFELLCVEAEPGRGAGRRSWRQKRGSRSGEPAAAKPEDREHVEEHTHAPLIPTIDQLTKLLLDSPRLQAIAASRTSYTPSVWLLEQELRARDLLSDPTPLEGESKPSTPRYFTVSDIYAAARNADSTGVCFSGGGIRSATFNLGILQGLARLDLLKSIEFLSSVSGGGYIHQFLAAWFRNYRRFTDGTDCEDVRAYIQKQLTPLPQERGVERLTEQPDPIRWLRRYSNYLTPRTGLLSPDTWVVGAVWLRNTFLNQLVLVTTLAAGLAVPHLFTPTDVSMKYLSHVYARWRFLVPVAGILILSAIAVWRSAVLLLRRQSETANIAEEERTFPRGWKVLPGLLLGIAILASPVAYRSVFTTESMVVNSSAPPAPNASATGQLKAGDVAVNVTVIAEQGNGSQAGDERHQAPPLCGNQPCNKIAIGIGGYPPRDPQDCPYCARPGHGLDALKAWFARYKYPMWTLDPNHGGLVMAALLFFLGLYAAIVAVASVPWNYVLEERDSPDPVGPQQGPGMVLALTLAALVLSIVAGWGALNLIRVLFFSLFFFVSPTLYQPLAVVFMPVALVAVMFLCQVISAGIMGNLTYASLREDLARLRALSSMWCAGWLAFTGFSLLGATILGYVLHLPYVREILSLSWIGATLGGVLAGKSPSTGGGGGKNANDSKPSFNLLVAVGPPGFAIGLLLLISAGVQWLVQAACLVNACTEQSFIRIVVLTAILGGIGAFFGFRLDINDFSMHAFYRDRIARCYAGASHPRRRPDPFTGFATTDAEIRVIDLLPKNFDAARMPGFQQREEPPEYAGPFPIFCSTVNLTFGQDLAWQERKGASFVFTPLYSGYSVGFTAERRLRKRADYTYNGFTSTSTYAYKNGGIHMHSAVAISGAAISPNWGYHTNPAMAFLLTMFNVRLGWWIKNPRLTQQGAQTLSATPPFPLRYLVDELLGRANDTHKYVYLTDGGHFDNMGLYELVRRRCRRILVCDAEQDPHNTFEGIGSAIRKARVDFGVEINLDLRKLDSRVADPPTVPPASLAPCHYVVGTIRYPEDGWNQAGEIIYIKASVTGDEPGDVLNYRREHEEFPHETTEDQWFSESQFESYRRLGYHIVLEEPRLRNLLRHLLDKSPLV